MVQLVERIASFRTITVGHPVPISMRVVYISGDAFKVYKVSSSTHFAFYRLLDDCEWNHKRERNLYLGLDAPGPATHSRTPHSITFVRGASVYAVNIDNVLDETTESQDWFVLRTGDGSGSN